MTDFQHSRELEGELVAVLGPRGWLAGAEAESYRRDWLDRHGEAPLGVARPATTAEVSATVAACHRAGVPVVPQGGNTSLCGASVAGQAGAVILSLSRMNAIAPPDVESGSVLVEAGVVLAKLHEALAGTGLMFPLHLGAEGSARIGGLIGTNAGGSHAFRHGMMGDLVLGLEVVLPDGRVWEGLRGVQKDNAGYQLRRLFCGAEGTLGVVTRAVLKLAAAPRAVATALLALPGFDELVRFGALLRREAADVLQAAEFFSETGLALALAHVPGLGFPLETRAGAYLLVELASSSPLIPLDAMVLRVVEQGMEEGLVTDGAIATSEGQRAAFWRLREEQPEGQRLEGPQLKHDIAVPPGSIAAFVKQGSDLSRSLVPGVRINPFGHLADGNIHFNLSPPPGCVDFAGKDAEAGLALARLATEMGGSFAAEHGIGRSKIALAEALRSPVERQAMRKIKAALDPAGLMNPGVIVGK
jgi:FAD/FMN-containing dehydrogenase